MKISMDELKLISDYMIEELKNEGHGAVELNSDYYWYIAGDDRESFVEKPHKLCVGSLIDDWQELQKIKSRKFVTWVDIERFANILISIVEEISKPYKKYVDKHD